MAVETSENQDVPTLCPPVAGIGFAKAKDSASDIATRKFIRDVLFANLPVPFQKLRTYLWLIAMTRALGAEGFGVWSLFILALSNATTIATLNCGSSLMRFLSGKRTSDEVSGAFSTVLAMVGAASAILILMFLAFSGPMTAILFHSQKNRILIALLAGALLVDCAFEEMKNLLRARRLNKSWALLSLARLIPEIGATLTVAWWLRSVEAVSWTYLGVGGLSVIGGYLYVRNVCYLHHASPARRIAIKYAKFGLPLLPGVLASAVSFGADKYLVGYYLGLRQVGIYSVCFTVSALTFFLLGPINDVLFPELSALHDTEQLDSFHHRFSGIQKCIFGFSVGASAILAAFPQQVLRVFASRDFAAGGTTLAILGVQGIFMALVLLYAVILNVRMRVWFSTLFWVASAVLILLLDVALIPRVGIAGAAVSQLIATAAGAMALIVFHWELFRRTFDFRWLLQTGMAFALVCLIATAWPATLMDFKQSIMKITAGGLVFILCLFATRFIQVDDLRLMKEAAG
ncbi:MAG TPA: oligosaccharide flippase family protein [Candidatus Acidoferrales bacterium]|nr:oligosaccharide flippase family protein [Candidatus Acidoferrales bacterium]